MQLKDKKKPNLSEATSVSSEKKKHNIREEFEPGLEKEIFSYNETITMAFLNFLSSLQY